MNTASQIHERLASLQPQHVTLTDDSAQHRGHAGAAGGGGHFRLMIVAQCFTGLPHLARHRLVYDALGDMMRQQIHALSIDARTAEEYNSIATEQHASPSSAR